jgi:hypothetical protein
MDKLPATLQFLGSEKKREQDTVLRMMCVEILLLLSTSEFSYPCRNAGQADKTAYTGRQSMRDRGAYYVVREAHKVETDQQVSVYTVHASDYLLIGADQGGHRKTGIPY